MASENVARPRMVVGERAETNSSRKFSVAEIALASIAVCAAIAIARIAQPFLVPVVMGILLSYALRPLVSMLERVRVPRFAAATMVIAILLALASTAVYVVRDHVNGWVAELPAAARKVRQAVADSARQAPRSRAGALPSKC